MTAPYTPHVDDQKIEDCQIGKGVKPLAQHGVVVFAADGTFYLLGTKGDVLDSAPVSEVSGKRIKVTFGQSVSLKVQDRKYNVGARANASLATKLQVAKQLLALIESGGKPTAL